MMSTSNELLGWGAAERLEVIVASKAARIMRLKPIPGLLKNLVTRHS